MKYFPKKPPMDYAAIWREQDRQDKKRSIHRQWMVAAALIFAGIALGRFAGML